MKLLIKILAIVFILCNLLFAFESYSQKNIKNNPPNWFYSNTGSNHTVLILSTAIFINGNAAENGDYIGAFYDSLGTLACGGYTVWNGATTSVAAWGDDPMTDSKDGFDYQEKFTWLIWSSSENKIYHAEAEYDEEDFPNSGTYSSNGMSGITKLTAYSSQSINITKNWNIISTYIEPLTPNPDSVFAENILNIIVLKNELGQIFIPQSINEIGTIEAGIAYQLKSNEADTITINGNLKKSENLTITASYNYSLIAFTRKDTISAVSFFSQFSDNILFIKDNDNRIYVPDWNINTMSNLSVGKGYKAVFKDTLSFIFPNEEIQFPKADTIEIQNPAFFKFDKNTGNSMILIIPKHAWKKTPMIGDEVGVKSESGNIFGSSIYNDDDLAIIIHGDDETTQEIDGLDVNEPFSLWLWQKLSSSLDTLKITKWSNGSAHYLPETLCVIDSIKIVRPVDPTIFLINIFSNPLDETIKLNLNLPSDTYIEISSYNIVGQFIETLLSENLSKGTHFLEFAINYSTGIYFFKVKTPFRTSVYKLMTNKSE